MLYFNTNVGATLHTGPSEVTAGNNQHLALGIDRPVALGMHEALAIDDVDFGPTTEQFANDLTTGEILVSASGKYRDDAATILYVMFEDRKKADPAVVVGKSRDDVESAVPE